MKQTEPFEITRDDDDTIEIRLKAEATVRIAADDKATQKLLMLALTENGCTDEEVCSVFGYTTRQLRNIRSEFQEKGGMALVDKRGWNHEPYKADKQALLEIGAIAGLNRTLNSSLIADQYNQGKAPERRLSDRHIRRLFAPVRSRLQRLWPKEPASQPSPTEEEQVDALLERGYHTNDFGACWILLYYLLTAGYHKLWESLERFNPYQEGITFLQVALQIIALTASGWKYISDTRYLRDRGLGLLLGRTKAYHYSYILKMLSKATQEATHRLKMESASLALRLGLLRCDIVLLDNQHLPYWGKVELPSGYNGRRHQALPGFRCAYAHDLQLKRDEEGKVTSSKTRSIFFQTNAANISLSQCLIELVKAVETISDCKDFLLLFDSHGFKLDNFRWLNASDHDYVTIIPKYRYMAHQWEGIAPRAYHPYSFKATEETYEVILIAEIPKLHLSVEEEPTTRGIVLRRETLDREDFSIDVEYTIFGTSLDTPCEEVPQIYSLRQNQENKLKELLHDYHIDASYGYGELPEGEVANQEIDYSIMADRRDLANTFKLNLEQVLALFQQDLGPEYEKHTLGTMRKLILRHGATLKREQEDGRPILHVILDPIGDNKLAQDLRRVIEKINSKRVEIPWLGGCQLMLSLPP